MGALKPPVFATWLLALTGSGAWSEALAGDLMEEFQQRRSLTWYWRQVLTAVAVSIGRDLCAHWVIALRALVVALLAGYSSGVLLDKLPFQQRLISLGTPLFGELPSALVIVAFHEFFVCAVAGWAVARTHRARQVTMVFFYAAALLGFNIWWGISNFVHGWGKPGGIRFLALHHGFTMVMLAGALLGGLATRAGSRTTKAVR